MLPTQRVPSVSSPYQHQTCLITWYCCTNVVAQLKDFVQEASTHRAIDTLNSVQACERHLHNNSLDLLLFCIFESALYALRRLVSNAGASSTMILQQACKEEGTDAVPACAAADACTDVDVCIFFVGSSMMGVHELGAPGGGYTLWSATTEGEGFDRSHLKLPGSQEEIIKVGTGSSQNRKERQRKTKKQYGAYINYIPCVVCPCLLSCIPSVMYMCLSVIIHSVAHLLLCACLSSYIPWLLCLCACLLLCIAYPFLMNACNVGTALWTSSLVPKVTCQPCHHPASIMLCSCIRLHRWLPTAVSLSLCYAVNSTYMYSRMQSLSFSWWHAGSSSQHQHPNSGGVDSRGASGRVLDAKL